MSFAQILEDINGENSRRMNSKVPEWSGIEGLRFPTRLCAEQCSSGKAAFLKIEAAADLCADGDRSSLKEWDIADLTGGIGVDSWAFSHNFAQVLHNEKDKDLSQAAEHNFKLLGAKGIRTSNIEITPINILEVLNTNFERSERPTLVYLDPARRSGSGGKVFRISDCTPNVLDLLPIIFQRCRYAMIKLSPMADIDLCIKELNGALGIQAVKEVNCIGVSGECKELLFCLDKQNDSPALITVRDGDFRFSFTRDQESKAKARFPESERLDEWLFEPGSALAKSGGFKLVSERFSIAKLATSTQLYLSGTFIPELSDAGKWFRIKEVLPFSKESAGRISRDYPQCEVSSRNLPIRSDELRKRLRVRSGGNIHIFGLLAETAGGQKKLLLVCECE